MDAIVAVDEDFQIIAFNPAAEAMFGIDGDAVVGQSLDRFIPARFRSMHKRHVERFAHTGASYRRMGALGALSALRANGEEFPVEASISQTVVEGGRISTVIIRDISERKASEASLLLAREVDHRAKNILSIVASLIELTPATDLESYAKSLLGRVAAMSRANSLLAAKRWSGASLARLVRDEIDAHAGARRISAEGPDLALVTRAAQPISMMLHELATNAFKHGALGTPTGEASIRWWVQPDGSLRLLWQERGGPPVEAPAQTGFGMTLLRQIIDVQLDGAHSFEWHSEGLKFAAYIPPDVLQASPAEPAPAAPQEPVLAPFTLSIEPEEQHGAMGTLLIVEDEPLLAMQMSQALETFGWTVVGVAGSIDSASRLLGTLPRPDAAMLDVDLDGTSVFPVARALRRAGIPFIFCTGFEDIGYTREFADCPVVRKPATIFQIVTALRQAVQGAGDAGAD